MFNFEDGQLIENAYVEINGVKYPVTMPKYSGNTPLTAETFNLMQKELLKVENPVGHIRMETTNVNPATYLGFGTWQYWGQGRVPVGVDASDNDFNTVEKTGGEKKHTMTLAELVDHTHVLVGSAGTAHDKIETAAYGSNTSGNNIILSHTGRRAAIQHPTKIHNLLYVEENGVKKI